MKSVIVLEMYLLSILDINVAVLYFSWSNFVINNIYIYIFFFVGRGFLGLVTVQTCGQKWIQFWVCCILRASDSRQVQKVTVLSALCHQRNLIEMGCKLCMVLSVL